MSDFIQPNWPLPAGVSACSTTRLGGVSLPPYASLNLGAHVGDVVDSVQNNRLWLEAKLGLPSTPVWLEQVHGTQVVSLDGLPLSDTVADAAYSRTMGQVCTIMTADCLPVLFCSLDGKEVAAAHAGWRGLCAGILEQTVERFLAPKPQIMAWLGPAIGPTQFEVGGEVRERFMTIDPLAERAFVAQGDKYLANIYLLARQRLNRLGIDKIYGGDFCTMSDPSRFFSYRRDGVTGRMASLIWINYQ